MALLRYINKINFLIVEKNKRNINKDLGNMDGHQLKTNADIQCRRGGGSTWWDSKTLN